MEDCYKMNSDTNTVSGEQPSIDVLTAMDILENLTLKSAPYKHDGWEAPYKDRAAIDRNKVPNQQRLFDEGILYKKPRHGKKNQIAVKPIDDTLNRISTGLEDAISQVNHSVNDVSGEGVFTPDQYHAIMSPIETYQEELNNCTILLSMLKRADGFKKAWPKRRNKHAKIKNSNLLPHSARIIELKEKLSLVSGGVVDEMYEEWQDENRELMTELNGQLREMDEKVSIANSYYDVMDGLYTRLDTFLARDLRDTNVLIGTNGETHLSMVEKLKKYEVDTKTAITEVKEGIETIEETLEDELAKHENGETYIMTREDIEATRERLQDLENEGAGYKGLAGATLVRGKSTVKATKEIRSRVRTALTAIAGLESIRDAREKHEFDLDNLKAEIEVWDRRGFKFKSPGIEPFDIAEKKKEYEGLLKGLEPYKNSPLHGPYREYDEGIQVIDALDHNKKALKKAYAAACKEIKELTLAYLDPTERSLSQLENAYSDGTIGKYMAQARAAGEFEVEGVIEPKNVLTGKDRITIENTLAELGQIKVVINEFNAYADYLGNQELGLRRGNVDRDFSSFNKNAQTAKFKDLRKTFAKYIGIEGIDANFGRASLAVVGAIDSLKETYEAQIEEVKSNASRLTSQKVTSIRDLQVMGRRVSQNKRAINNLREFRVDGVIEFRPELLTEEYDALIDYTALLETTKREYELLADQRQNDRASNHYSAFKSELTAATRERKRYDERDPDYHIFVRDARYNLQQAVNLKNSQTYEGVDLKSKDERVRSLFEEFSGTRESFELDETLVEKLEAEEKIVTRNGGRLN